MAGLLFNLLVDHTIIKFGELFTPKVLGGITLAWSAFRDVANIVIIAMFVFTAINIILGVKEFGEKKLIARILIIAVLINFSLLFTKAIIDASNFTALQFYKASQLSGEAESKDQLTTLKTFSSKGISGQFIDLMGLSSLAETSNAISNAAYGDASNKYVTASGWIALLFGLFAATLLLAAAAVLLYGCLLLVTRAVLLILLMLTSAIAFASWLVPHQFVSQGWTTWWKSLLKTAFFAPILMIFLWGTVLVARAVKPAGGALGSLAKDPTSSLDLNVLFSYAIVIGLLFASFKFSSSFASGISGFSATQGALTTGARIASAVGLTYGAYQAQGLGFLFRNTAGKYGKRWLGDNVMKGTMERDKRWASMSAQERQASLALGERPPSTRWERARMGVGTLLGKSTFDASKTGIMKSAMKAVGAVNFAPEIGKGGYVGVKERQAEEALKRARDMGYKSQEETRAAAENAAKERQAGERRRLNEQEEAHKNAKSGGNLEAARASGRSRKEEERQESGKTIAEAVREAVEEAAGHETAVSGAREQRRHHAGVEEETGRQIREVSANIAQAREQALAATGNATVPRALEVRLEQLEAQQADARTARELHDSNIQERTGAAREKRMEAERLNKMVEEAGQKAVEEVKRTADENLENIARTREQLDAAAKEAGRLSAETVSAEAIAAQSGHTRLSTGYGIKQFFISPEQFEKEFKEDPVVKRIQKASRKYNDREAALRITERMKEVGISGTGGTAPSTPSAPAAPRPSAPPPSTSSGPAA